jgi:excisionase family DNA binding protein
MLTIFDDFGRWTGPTFWINPETGEWRLVSSGEDGQRDSVAGLVQATGIEPSLDVKAAARILGCSAGQIHTLCSAGELSFHWLGTKRRFTREDLETFRARNTVQPRDKVSLSNRTKTGEGGKKKKRAQHRPGGQEHNDAVRTEVSREDLKRRLNEWH